MKVLIADKLPDKANQAFIDQGFQTTVDASLKDDALKAAIADHDVLVVRSTKVNAEILAAGENLALVIRAGAGTNTIDVAEASKRGIYVANCPGKNAVAVAELTLGLLLALDRSIPMAHAALKNGAWEKSEFGKADGLAGKSLGIIGFGTIGKAVAAGAKGLGLNVHAWSRSLTEKKAAAHGVIFAASMEDLVARCDIFTIHLARTPQTQGLVDDALMTKMKAGAMIINTARDGIVDEAALLKHLDNGHVRYATDVFENEPGGGKADFEHPLAQHPQVVCTPHIGASTSQAQEAVANHAIKIAKRFRDTGRVLDCVNLSQGSSTPHTLIVRHLDKVGALAGILELIKGEDINVQELENSIFGSPNDTERAAVAHISVSKKPGPQTLAAINDLESVIDAVVR